MGATKGGETVCLRDLGQTAANHGGEGRGCPIPSSIMSPGHIGERRAGISPTAVLADTKLAAFPDSGTGGGGSRLEKAGGSESHSL